ncbi:MAG: tryptophan synthase subunit alpha [Syntrophomonadaceae bacterium]|nr:tryptophan synthase subunit alpha [Syntrophomonadaceae bacterium]
MSKVQQAFARGKAFIPFITAGDPSLEITEKLVIGMAAAGADLIEIGIPFSDPVAEGLVIQRADERALAAGTTTDKVFDMVRNIRQVCDVPLAFMTYMNPVFTFGTDRFMQNCQETGIDAVIIPDLPFEEKEELLPACSQYGVDLISLIAPTSHDRIHMIAREAQGFMYCVSSMGVTGAREELNSQAGEMIRLVKEASDIPCAVGFGISTPEQAAQMARFADGVIVGSAIVKIVEQYGADCVPQVVDFVRTMKQAIAQT